MPDGINYTTQMNKHADTYLSAGRWTWREKGRCAWAHTSLIYLRNRSKPCTCLKEDLNHKSTSSLSRCTAQHTDVGTHTNTQTVYSLPSSTFIHNAWSLCLVIGSRERERERVYPILWVWACACLTEKGSITRRKSFTRLKRELDIPLLRSHALSLALCCAHNLSVTASSFCPVTPPVSCSGFPGDPASSDH